MTFDLPPTGTDPSPAFANPITAQDWLATVPLANAVQAQSMFLRQLNLLHRYSLPEPERFAILETLRGPICDVQEDAAKKFAARPLPLAPHEQAALDSTLNVWQMLALGYLRCFEALCSAGSGDLSPSALIGRRTLIAGDPDLAARLATLAQRTFSVFADWQVDLCRGQQLPEGSYWKKLNQIFTIAETLGVAGRAINDPTRHGNAPTSALAAFGECNLLSTAKPYELPARHLAWIARWARRWGAKLALLKMPPEDIRNRAVPLWVDLESDRPANYTPRTSSGGRWLETTELRKSLVARIALLEKGRAPAELQLGDDVTQPAAGQLLQRVLQRWCKGGVPRRHERRAADGRCTFIAGFEAAHFHLSGRKIFHAPSRDETTLRREREKFETFGDRSTHDEGGTDSEGNARLENWTIMDDWRLLDESAAGLRIARPLKEGVRIGAGLLIAVRTQQDGPFALGNVRWALRESGDSLSAGIQLFPGEPRPVAIRTQDADGRGSWRQGFLLPEVDDLKEPASLIIPVGTFRIDRSVEVMIGENARTLRLFRVMDRGTEFERCNFHD